MAADERAIADPQTSVLLHAAMIEAADSPLVHR